MDTSRDKLFGCYDQHLTGSSTYQTKSNNQPQLTEDALRHHNEKKKQDVNSLKRAQEEHTIILRELRRLGVNLGDDFAHKITPAGEGMAPIQRLVQELGGQASSDQAAWISRERSAGSRDATKASSNNSG
ncbi:hypothetical protein Landi51_06651 [Colletotrichum acutatum]